MPFEAIAISHETLEALKVADKKAELANTNPYTIEWFLRNNIMDCRYGRIFSYSLPFLPVIVSSNVSQFFEAFVKKFRAPLTRLYLFSYVASRITEEKPGFHQPKVAIIALAQGRSIVKNYAEKLHL